MILIYITSPSEDESKKIATHLLEKKLIACANIFPVNSMYWWKGKIADGKECVLVAKTIEENFEKVKEEVERIHSYNIPCIVKISVHANEKFEDWVENEVRFKSQRHICERMRP